MADTNRFKFPWERNADEEAIRKRSIEFQKKQGMQGAPEEKGIEEQELEDIVPGGSYLSAALPLGAGKKLLTKGGRMLAEEAIPVAKTAGGVLDDLAKVAVERGSKAKNALEEAVGLGRYKTKPVKLTEGASEGAVKPFEFEKFSGPTVNRKSRLQKIKESFEE